METYPASKMLCFFKQLDDGESPQKGLLISCQLCCVLFDLLTFEDGTNRLSWNVSKELPLFAA